MLQEVGRIAQPLSNPHIFSYPLHINIKFMYKYLIMYNMCKYYSKTKITSNTKYLVYEMYLLGYTLTLYLLQKVCKLVYSLSWVKDKIRSVKVNGVDTSAPVQYNLVRNKVLTCNKELRSSLKLGFPDIDFGAVGQMVQLSKIDLPETILEVRFGSLQGHAPPDSVTSDANVPQAASINQNTISSVNTTDSGFADNSDTLNQSAEQPGQTQASVSSPAITRNSSSNHSLGLSYLTDGSASEMYLGQSLVSESPLSGDEIGQIHYEAERSENSIINEYMDPHPSSPMSFIHDQPELSGENGSVYQENSWLWDMVNDAQFDQLMSDYEGIEFLRENMGGREEDLNNFIQELEIQLDNQGNPDDIFDSAGSISFDSQELAVTYSSAASSPPEPSHSQGSDITLVPGSEPDQYPPQSSPSTSSISSRERDFRNFGDRFDAENIHEYGVYPDAYIDHSFSTGSHPSSPENQPSQDDNPLAETPEIAEARFITQHNLAQFCQYQDMDMEQIVPNSTVMGASDYGESFNIMLRTAPPVQANTLSTMPWKEEAHESFLQRPHTWETNPENEEDREAIALNLEYLEYDLSIGDSILSLDVLHTRAELVNSEIIQEFVHEREAGGQTRDNPDLVIPDIDANAVIADGIWETYLLEQEYRTNPEGFPVQLSNQYGNFISIEEDYGIDIDEVHFIAQSQELTFIRNYELSQRWINPFQPP